MRFAWLFASIIPLLYSAPPSLAGEQPPPVPAPTEPAATPLSIAQAAEGVSDEDLHTRAVALARLQTATAVDIPELEKYAQNPDVEIRRQVDMTLKRLNCGELALQLAYPDGTPAAGLKLGFKMTCDAHPAIRLGGIKVADEHGKISFGQQPDDNYVLEISTRGGVPDQEFVTSIKLAAGAAPKRVVIHRGVHVTVTCVDGEGHPIEGALVMDTMALRLGLETKHLDYADFFVTSQNQVHGLTNQQGQADLWVSGIVPVNLDAMKRGYTMVFDAKAQTEAGLRAAATLKLAAVPQVPTRLTVTTGTFHPLVRQRIMLVPLELQEVLTARTLKTVAEYVKAGAIDAGTTDEKGVLSAKLWPDRYGIIAIQEEVGQAHTGGTTRFSAAGEATGIVNETPLLTRPEP